MGRAGVELGLGKQAVGVVVSVTLKGSSSLKGIFNSLHNNISVIDSQQS